MRYRLILLALACLAITGSGAAALPAATQANVRRAAARAEINPQQARDLARLTAAHDHIDLNNSYIEMHSMDLMRPLVAGFSSFIVLRDATTPGPDPTLHRYAVNRRSGDVWEMTTCTRYDFPALQRLQRSLVGRLPSAAEVSAERAALGCSRKVSSGRTL